MTLQRIDRGDMTAKPQSCNMVIVCEICARIVPAGEEYYEVQVGNGDGYACSNHSADELDAYYNYRDDADE